MRCANTKERRSFFGEFSIVERKHQSRLRLKKKNNAIVISPSQRNLCAHEDPFPICILYGGAESEPHESSDSLFCPARKLTFAIARYISMKERPPCLRIHVYIFSRVSVSTYQVAKTRCIYTHTIETRNNRTRRRLLLRTAPLRNRASAPFDPRVEPRTDRCRSLARLANRFNNVAKTNSASYAISGEVLHLLLSLGFSCARKNDFRSV